jgi:hypothetical protein
MERGGGVGSESGGHVLGEEHPSTLSNMANLAYTWESQDRDKKAIEVLARSERLQKQVLASDHQSQFRLT